jgi:hypothetical protein
MSVFDDSAAAIADRATIRHRAVQRINALQNAVKNLESASGAQASAARSEPLSSQTDISELLADAEDLRGEIEGQHSRLNELGAELAQAREFKSKMIKFGVIGGGIVLLLLVLLIMGS